MQRYSAGSYEIGDDDDGEYYLADEVDTAMQAKDAEIAELLKDVTFLQSGKDVIQDELRAEVVRLTAERDEWRGHVASANHERNAAQSDAREAAQIPSLMAVIVRLTAELATARAETAMAFEVAAKWLIRAGIAGDATEDPLATCIRTLTPADAKAALAARDRVTREKALRDAATQIDREISSDTGDWGSEFIAGLDRAKSLLK